MASTLDVNGQMTDSVAQRALGVPVCRVKRRHVPDTLDVESGPRL